MLNRTNRTLSANTNGLNLGTRSLALIPGANMDFGTLRNRQAHPQVQAAAQHAQPAKPIDITYRFLVKRSVVPMFPGSSSEVSWLPPLVWEPRPRSVVVAEESPVVRPVVADDRGCRQDRRARRWASPTLADAHTVLAARVALRDAAGG